MLVTFGSLVLLAALGDSRASGEAVVNDNAIIKDPVADLSWLRALPIQQQVVEKPKSLEDQRLDASASAIYDSTIVPNKGYQIPANEYSNLLAVSSIPAGKRRLDGGYDTSAPDIAAMASTGRSRANNYSRQQQQLDANLIDDEPTAAMKQIRADGHSTSRQANDFPGPPQSRHYYRGQDQLTNTNQNYNRRSLINPIGQQGNGYSRQQQQQQQHRRQVQMRQESRKNQMKPLVSRGAKQLRVAASKTEEDDIDSDDGDGDADESNSGARSSNRRSSSDPDADVDSDEEADGEDGAATSQSNARETSKRQLSSAQSKSQPRIVGQQQQRQSPKKQVNSNVDDGDEDIDASTERLGGIVAPRAHMSSPSSYPTLGIDDNGIGSATTTNSKAAAAAIASLGAVAGESNQLKQSSSDLQVAAGHHHHHHPHYYQHVEVPKKKSWKFGFKRGNHKHEIERHEKGHKHKFHSSFKWHAKEKCKKKKKCKSVGKMTWEYKHAKKHHK